MKFLVLLFGLFAATMGALAVFTPAGAKKMAQRLLKSKRKLAMSWVA